MLHEKTHFVCFLYFVVCDDLCGFFVLCGGVEATSPVFALSLKHDGVRQSAGVETLTYSSQWDACASFGFVIAESSLRSETSSAHLPATSSV